MLAVRVAPTLSEKPKVTTPLVKPTMLSLEQFRAVTGARDWPDFLAPYLRAGALEYFCNMRARYRVRGVGVSLKTRWDWYVDDFSAPALQKLFAKCRAGGPIGAGDNMAFVGVLSTQLLDSLFVRLDRTTTVARRRAIHYAGPKS